VPKNEAPSTPTEIMPTPLIAFKVRLPPLGNCPETIPKVVGQKKAFPIPYSVAAPNIAHSTAPALAIQSKPHIVLENVLIAKPQPGQDGVSGYRIFGEPCF
jgi:hypothetical protein